MAKHLLLGTSELFSFWPLVSLAEPSSIESRGERTSSCGEEEAVVTQKRRRNPFPLVHSNWSLNPHQSTFGDVLSEILESLL